MRQLVTHFDRVFAGYVGRLPSRLHTPFVWLGRFTTPLFWVTYLITIHILFVSPGVVTINAALVMVLIPLASLIKLFFRRKRPPSVYVDSMRIKSYSFPSSHAYSAMLSSVSLLAIASGGGVIAAVALIGLAAVIGISRVFVGAHYPSDVLAGWVLGLSVALVLGMLG